MSRAECPQQIDFILGSFEERDGKKCFSDSRTVLLHQMCRKSTPGSTQIYLFLPLAANGLSTTSGRQKAFLVYFQSVTNSCYTSNWQSTIVLLIKKKKKKRELIMCFSSSHSFFMDYLLNSAKNKETRQCSGLKRDCT